MATIKISVTGEICTVAQKVTFTAGSYGVYVAEVTTDASWDDLALVLCIISAPPGYPRMPNSGRCIKRSIPIKDGTAELDETIQPCMVSDNAILIGLLGCDADGKITRYSTVSAAGKVCGSGCIDDTILGDESRWAELISYINATIKSLIGTPTDEQVRSAVDDYAGEHGITTGATAEQAAQIAQNAAKIDTYSGILGLGTTADYAFVAGGISNDGTVNDTASGRVRSENYIFAKAGSTIAVKPGITATFNVAAYSDTATSALLSYRGMSSDPYTVDQDCYIRFGFVASDTTDPAAIAADTIDMHIIADILPDVRAQADQNTADIAALSDEASAIKSDLSQLSEEIENIDVSGCGSTTEYIEGDYKLNTLFDLDFTWFDGIRINSDGSELSNSSYTTTDYIPITPDMRIDDFYSGVYQNSFAFYDKKKNFIAFATDGESIPEKAAYMRYCTQITTLQITVDGFESRGTFKFWRQFPTDETDRNLGIPAKKSLMDTIYNPLKASATVNFYGDSNTYGYNVDQKSWAYYIAKRLKDTFNGTKLYYYGGSPYVQAWGMNTSSSLATLCLKSLSGSTISDAAPFVKFKTNAEKVYCGWMSVSNSSTYAILVDEVVQESGSVTSTGAYETEITLDGDFHTIMIKPYGNSTINNPYFAIEKQISFNNYGKAGVTSQNLPVSGLDTCDFAIVLIGTNDGNNSVYTGIQNGVTFLKFGDHADKCIFIEPLFKCDGKENSHILCNNHISQICDLMGIRHLRLDSLTAIFGLQYAVLMQSDGLHYSTQGHITIANAVSAALGFATNYKTDYADTDTIGNIFDNLAQ